MPLSLNEIRTRAFALAKEYENETSEDMEAQTFWNAFFLVFGVNRRRVATFETPVKKKAGASGYIDLLWKGTLLIEHKSRGRDLDRAKGQAFEYFSGLKDRDLPRYVIVSDFARIRVYDLEPSDGTHNKLPLFAHSRGLDLEGDGRTYVEFPLSDLPQNIGLFGFLSGYTARSFGTEDPANVKAAERLGQLHDLLEASGYEGHELEVFLVRVLFCLFADDTGIFERGTFRQFVEQRTAEDGSDLGMWLNKLFDVLNRAESRRAKALDEQLAAFPYVNGKLFAEPLAPPDFDSKMRETLFTCLILDWSRINPSIFGSLFQSIMDKSKRRNLGAHYTSETNILKALRPLFLDDLRAEFERVRGNVRRLREFHDKLARITLLDPACGCGNFLVIAYRELRLLEIDVLKSLLRNEGNLNLDALTLVRLDVDQFFGIEIEEWPAQIAQVALWLMDHLMNLAVSAEFGQYFARLPLQKSPVIINGDALHLDWKAVVDPSILTYIVGNPPFIGHHLQTAEQKKTLRLVYGDEAKSAGVMDFVSAWFCKAASFIQDTRIKVAFVATNSITQGEQVGIMWRALRPFSLHIDFAHRTFKWTSEAKGKAAVYCVIIGFSTAASSVKRIYDYETVDGEPHETRANQINAYLVDAPWILMENRATNLCAMPEMMYGNKPTDGGHFLFTDEDKAKFLSDEPKARALVKPFVSAHEYLHGENRWVLWLVGATPVQIGLPEVRKRINAVSKFRKASKAPSTRDYPYPTLFRQVTQPNTTWAL